MAHKAGLMKVMRFRNPSFSISVAISIALIGVSTGPLSFAESLAMVQAASDPIIAAAGDIACDPTSLNFNDGEGNQNACRQKYTSDLLMEADLAAVLPLGDEQYYCGGYQSFLQSYGPSWGRVKSISHPVVGNHEYLTSGGPDCTSDNANAAGYFKYFGLAAGDPSQGYYSYDIGAWHLIALNSNCGDAGGCDYGSPQANWLLMDLTKHPNLCTLAYWHIPLFSSGGRTAANTQSIWQILYDHDVDVILNGHDHLYERFAPQTPDAKPDAVRGIRQFTVGTGGANLTDIDAIAANSEVLNNDTYGVLKLTLHPIGYDWQFVPEAGSTFTDSGTGSCHGDPMAATQAAALTPTVMPSPTPTVPPTPVITTFQFVPAADAYISKTRPTSSFGASNMLRVYGGPLGASYLRFNVQGLPGSVARASLRLYANSQSKSGYQVHVVGDNSWSESAITYQNAPPAGDLITSTEAFPAKQWTSVDLTSLVRGNGTYNIVVLTFNGDPLSFASREAILPYRPQLVVEVSGRFNSAPPGATQEFDNTDP